MKNSFSISIAIAALLATCAASAHVHLSPATGAPGSRWQGVLQVGHGCEGDAATTALVLRLPAGVVATPGEARAGWTVASSPGTVTWKAAAGAALPSKEKAEFPLALQLPAKAGPLWLKLRQECGTASAEWAEIPSQGTAVAGLKSPALLVDVAAAGVAAVAGAPAQVDGGWVRATVPGQQGTGAFMKLTVREPMQLVGVRTPVAGEAEVHEMKMDGSVMRMRAAGPIDLKPGQPLELKPGGYHLMLTGLKQPLATGAQVPLTLVLRDARGAERTVDVKLPVAMQGPATGHSH